MAALYADIAAKQVRARIQQNKLGKTQYDYDSDEDTEGGKKKQAERLKSRKRRLEVDRLDVQ